MNSVYPWSAVVGQGALQHALLLCAIDPAIGGVLVKGPRGVGKTTLARALSEFVEGPFVELPLGASEERVTGTLDLEKALQGGRVAFAPGLLARAHGGVLYVDEVNLLPDALVDLLLDAAASGRNVVERDGISHVHPARFVLMGTMNPDEGELRPQLSDRFGLSVTAEQPCSPDERREIVARRLAFDEAPACFVAEYAAAQATLIGRCQAARALLPSLELRGPALSWVTERCHAAGVEGVRADLAMLRAARANAAWHGRREIIREDVVAVAALALAHRMPEGSSGPSSSSGGHDPKAGGGSTHGGGRNPAPSAGAPHSGARAAPASSGEGAPSISAPRAQTAHDTGAPRGDLSHWARDAGALRPVPVGVGPSVRIPKKLIDRGSTCAARRRGRARVRAAHGARAELGADACIDWFVTLARTRSPTRADLQYRARRAPRAMLWILLVDCSASMLRAGALSAAKSVALALSTAARRTGAQLTLVTFHGDGARVALDAQARPGRRADTLRTLGAGGGTPLYAALATARALCKTPRFAGRQLTKRLFVLTDGRARAPLSAALAETTSSTVIDCERGRVRLGRARVLASTLNAELLHVDALTPTRAAPGLSTMQR